MSLYNHTPTLLQVDASDRGHVEDMLCRLDSFAQEGGESVLGDFLLAIVNGDLMAAVAHADETNAKYLCQYARYVFNQLPGTHVLVSRPVLRMIKTLQDAVGPVTTEMVEQALEEFRAALSSRVRAVRC